MKRRYLGDLETSEMGLGCLSMTAFYDNPPDPAESIATIHRAADLGINILDTADFYGAGENEKLVGRAIQGRRDKYLICTKFGQILQNGVRAPISDGNTTVSGRPEWAQEACEASLRRLNIDVIDLYYLHRVDPNVSIEETVGAMAKLVAQGKVRRIGLCEAAATTLRAAHKVFPITALQTEYSLWTRDVEGGLTELCDTLGVGFVAYSPLGRGFLTGGVNSVKTLAANDVRRIMPRFQQENFQKNLVLVEQLRQIAEREGGTPAQVAIAWLLSRTPSVVPLVGTSKVSRLEENAGAIKLSLSEQTLATLDRIFDPSAIAGARANEAQLSRIDHSG
jgi:aryl-alcohol dehydrogenase-like predicted oxidoreductase